jgi:hypothetical protein
MQVAERFCADRLVQPADAERGVSVGANQLGHQVARCSVIRGVELYRPLGFAPGRGGQRVGRQRAERLDELRAGRQQAGQDLT